MRAQRVLGGIVASAAIVACGIDVVGGATSPTDGVTSDGGAGVDGASPVTDRGPGGSPDGGAEPDAGGDSGASVTLTVVVTGTSAATGAIVSSAGGLSCPGACALTVPAGSSVTLSSAAPADDSLVSWSGGGCAGRDPSCTVKMDASKTVTVTFAALRHFVHSTTRLYSVDGVTGAATQVADFGGGCAGVVMGDLAIDRAGVMWAISFPSGSSQLYTVNPSTAACSASIGSLGVRCNGLTAAPDPANPTSDALYAGCTTSFYAVNKATGAATLVGAFGGGWSSSGDLVWVPGAGLYGTFENGGSDRLGKVDVATGAVTIVGDTAQGNLWGLGQRGGKVLAWNGGALSLSLASGAATSLVGSQGFTAYGAASGP